MKRKPKNDWWESSPKCTKIVAEKHPAMRLPTGVHDVLQEAKSAYRSSATSGVSVLGGSVDYTWHRISVANSTHIHLNFSTIPKNNWYVEFIDDQAVAVVLKSHNTQVPN